MPHEDSPSIESFTEGTPEPTPQSISGRKRLWITIGILALLVLLLLAGNLLRSHSFTSQSGSGNVVGQVVDDQNQPIQAEAFLFGSKTIIKSGLDGHFELHQAPAGTQNLVITYQGGAKQFPIVIKNGEILDVGIIHMSATAEP
jgi:hypothetical protein